MMEHFYPKGCGHFQDASTPIHRARAFTECFGEDEIYYDLYIIHYNQNTN